jgi:hypothetical protein
LYGQSRFEPKSSGLICPMSCGLTTTTTDAAGTVVGNGRAAVGTFGAAISAATTQALTTRERSPLALIRASTRPGEGPS